MNVVGTGPTAEAVRAYYHVYAAGGRWRTIVRRHLTALAESGIQWDLVFGIVGSRNDVRHVTQALPSGVRIESWPDGFEQRTLNLIVDDIAAGYDGPVMYAHTKGAGYPLQGTASWRRCMTRRVVTEAKVCLDHLADGADVVGAHWLTPEEWGSRMRNFGDVPFFGGNFWWATSEHLRRLERPAEVERYDAERWLGTVRPHNPVNLAPGWPGLACKTHL